MLKHLAIASLALGTPLAAWSAYEMLSYYGAIGGCARLSGAAQDACLLEYAKNMPEPALEVAMATCRKADLFLALYKADESTRRKFHSSREEVEARHAAACNE